SASPLRSTRRSRRSIASATRWSGWRRAACRPEVPLRVGIDYLPAVTHVPGMARYAPQLVRAPVRLAGPPALPPYEVGRARPSGPEAARGLPGASSTLRRVRSSTPRSIARWSPLRTVRCADLALGGVDLFHHTSRFLPRVADARETLAVSEIPAP